MTQLWAVTLALAMLLAPPAALQQQKQQQQKEDQPAVIKDIVELVNVLVTVKDKKGRLINTLEKKDFEVFEDGRQQEIRQFSRETDLPLTIGLLVDTSPSQGRLIPMERDASITFLDTVLKTKDMAFLISFDSDVDLLQDFTNTRNLLRRGLDKLHQGGGGVSGGPFPSQQTGGTHLYDAVYLAAADKLSTEVGRKAIVVVTDGEDQGSRVKVDAAIEAAQKADVIIYGVLLVDRAFYGRGGMMMGGYGGEGVLKKMSDETGGHMVRADKDLRAAFDELAAEMRSQYSLAYSPTNPKRDGGFRKLTVKVTQPDTKVQTRKGYYAVPPTS